MKIINISLDSHDQQVQHGDDEDSGVDKQHRRPGANISVAPIRACVLENIATNLAL